MGRGGGEIGAGVVDLKSRHSRERGNSADQTIVSMVGDVFGSGNLAVRLGGYFVSLGSRVRGNDDAGDCLQQVAVDPEWAALSASLVREFQSASAFDPMRTLALSAQ